MSGKTLSKIHQLKGMIDTMAEMAETDNELDHPMIDKLSKTVNEIVETIEEENQ
jgi:hypothetical protein